MYTYQLYFYCLGLAIGLFVLGALVLARGRKNKLAGLIIALGLVGGWVAGDAIAARFRSGQDSWWQRLPDLPEPPVSIVAVWHRQAIDDTPLFVSARSGKVYVYSNYWVEVVSAPFYAEVLAYPGSTPRPCAENPHTRGRFPGSNLPQPIVQCAYVQLTWEWVASDIYYVLLQDGSLWRWHYYAGIDLDLSGYSAAPWRACAIGVKCPGNKPRFAQGKEAAHNL